MFCKTNSHHSASEFGPLRTPPLSESVQIHTWRDASLLELSSLLLASLDASLPLAAQKLAKVNFRLVRQERSGRFVEQDGGLINLSVASKAEEITLDTLGFEIGDILDVCLLTADAPVPPSAAAQASASGNRGGDPRRRDQGNRGRNGPRFNPRDRFGAMNRRGPQHGGRDSYRAPGDPRPSDRMERDRNGGDKDRSMDRDRNDRQDSRFGGRDGQGQGRSFDHRGGGGFGGESRGGYQGRFGR